MEEEKIIIPEEYTYPKLKKLYNEAGLSDDTYKLLRQYFRAMAQFYGAIELGKAYELISEYENRSITFEEFKAFSEIAVHEQSHFYIFDDSEIFSDTTPGPFESKRVIDLITFLDGNAQEMILRQSDKPYYYLEKNELLKFENADYNEKTHLYCVLCNYLEGLKHTKPSIIRDIVMRIPRIVEFEKNPPAAAIQILDDLEIILSVKEITPEFTKMLVEFLNNSRLYSNRGYTPNELREQFGARSIQPVRTTEKVGRNDPCPCGSGKKYKKCCGK